MELNRLSKGKGIADDGAGSGGAASRTSEDEEMYIELGVGNVHEVLSRRRQRCCRICSLAGFQES